MFASSSSSSSSLSFPWYLPPSVSKKQESFRMVPKTFRRPTGPLFLCLRLGVEDIAQVLHNKVLVSAAVASAVGQFSKPFTSVLYGRGVDFKAAVRSGGMPSTHSAGVAAAATALGLERGFSDSIFGMSVVFAAIVMYDAQGVRKEVGLHAKVINTSVMKPPNNTKCSWDGADLIESEQELKSVNSESLSSLISVSEKGSSCTSNPVPPPDYTSDGITRLNTFLPMSALTINGDKESPISVHNHIPLKESVGHTELEVLVGALLGVLVSSVFCTVL